MAEERVERRLAAILAADVVGYSRLMRADETGTRTIFNAHLTELINPKITDYRGRIVKTTGDGLLVEFASVVDAVQCAVDIQRGMDERNTDVPGETRIEFRIGVNLGDVIIEGDDIHGDGVNVAARLEGLAEPGGICISADVYGEIRYKLEMAFEDIGEQDVKNIPQPVRAYRLITGSDTTIGHPDAASGKTRNWKTPAAVAGIVALVAAGGVAWQRPRSPDVEPASINQMAFKLPDKPSIAVLPFDNLSGDKEQAYFADGLTEDIITNLASFPNLFVIARNSTNKFKGKAVDIRDVAHDLGVRYVLEGSVRRAGDTVRITAQLIDALNGSHIWAKSYDRELKDIFALQDEITGEIGSRLVSKVAAAEWRRRSRKGTRSVEAYDLFLRGWKIGLEFNPRSNARAISLIEQAIEKDPKFARAYAFLAVLRRNNAAFRWAKGPKNTLKHALELAQKAVVLDPQDGQPPRLLGLVYSSLGQYDRAIDVVEKSIALSPSNPEGLITLAYPLAFAGRGEETVRQAEMAMRLNPHAPWYYPQFAGFAYYAAKRFDKAVASFDRSRRLNPKNPVTFRWTAIAYAQLWEKRKSARRNGGGHETPTEIHGSGHNQAIKFQRRIRKLYLEGLRKAGFPEHPPLKLSDKPSIAVLPFTNISGDKAQEYFSDGITEDIITDLSKLSKLFVVARNSSFRYKGRVIDPKQVGRALRARYLLEGSVRRAGDRLRISAQLIDAETGGEIWSERYDGKLADTFALQDKVTGRIIEAMALKLDARERAKLVDHGTNHFAAHDAFLKGQEHARQYTAEGFVQAIREFERALTLDPHYHRASEAIAQARYIRENIGLR